MKLFDMAFDRAVEFSKPFVSLAASVKVCAESIEKLAQNLAVIAHNQAVHTQLINQMWNFNQGIIKKLGETALDTSMPDGKKSDKNLKNKPN